jgi:hypothetical protein
MESTKKFPREYGHGRANYINGPRVAGARSLPAKLDPVISKPGSDGDRQACTGSRPSIWFFQDHQWKQRHNPSYKQQATSVKPQAPIFRKRQAASVKLQALKLQATSVKL